MDVAACPAVEPDTVEFVVSLLSSAPLSGAASSELVEADVLGGAVGGVGGAYGAGPAGAIELNRALLKKGVPSS